MNLFQLVLKQMRQRALSTWLTMLSVLLGVALAVAILILRREAGHLFGQTDYGFDVLVGTKGSALQLVVNTVYHIDKSPGNISYGVYENLIKNPMYRADTRIAVPFAVGDSYHNLPIMGVPPKLFGFDDDGTTPLPPEKVLEYRPGKRYEIAQGRSYPADKFEAVIGSDVTRLSGLKLGDTFQATHGFPRPGEQPDIHKPTWTVVGVLAPTHTAADRVLHIPLISFYTLTEHEVGLLSQAALRGDMNPATAAEIANRPKPAVTTTSAAGHAHDDEKANYTLSPDGRIEIDPHELPKSAWALSGIMVKGRSAPLAFHLMYLINNGNQASAVNPASTMREFFANFLDNSSKVLLLISILVTVVAGVGILVSIYNSVSARSREIAILRALGATRYKVLAIICLEAGVVGLLGSLLGLVVGHLTAAGGSVAAERLVGQSIAWGKIGTEEVYYLVAVVVLAVLAGLVPALKAYRVPVATNLVAA